MSQLSDYRRETDQLVAEARAHIQHGFALLSQQPPNAAALRTWLNAFVQQIDRLETNADIRYDNFEEGQIVGVRLRKQRDETSHKCKALKRWVTQLQEQLAQYQAHYPEPPSPAPSAEVTALPPTRKKASKKPIQQAFDFTDPAPESPKE